jgi:hypothetical protein
MLSLTQLLTIPPQITDALYSSLELIIIAMAALIVACINAAASRIERKLDANHQLQDDIHADIEQQRQEVAAVGAMRRESRAANISPED